MKGLGGVLLLSLFAAATPGCGSTAKAMERANLLYRGQHLDTFVLKHGPPYCKYELRNGECLYRWHSDVLSYKMPATTSMSGTVSPYGQYHGTAITTGGGYLDVFCEIQIHTAKDGTILNITPVRDTVGRWKMSRAAEIFK